MCPRCHNHKTITVPSGYLEAFQKEIVPIVKSYGLLYSYDTEFAIMIWCPDCQLDKYCGHEPKIRGFET